MDLERAGAVPACSALDASDMSEDSRLVMQLCVEGARADVSMLLRNGTLEPPALQDNPGWPVAAIRKPISDLFMELHGAIKRRVALGNGAVPRRARNGLSLGNHV